MMRNWSFKMKYILKMAFRNIGRNKRRTILSASAISIAIMLVVIMRGFIGGLSDSMFDSLTKIETGHIKIENTKYYEKEDMMPLEYTVNGFKGEGYEKMLPILKSVKGVKTIIPRIKFGVLLSFGGKSVSVMGIGVDPVEESTITPYDKLMVKGEYLKTDNNAKSIIIGSGLADKLGIKLGEKLTIVSRTAFDSLKGMTFTVMGIFKYGISTLDEKLFYIPIGSAGRLLEMSDGVSELIIMVDKPENAEKIASDIKDKLQKQEGESNAPHYAVIPWQKQEGFSLIKTGQKIYSYIYLGFLILASTVIINTTMMVIFERTREIGTISALGMTGGQIVLLFTLEAAIVSAVGSLLGTLVGGGFDLLLSKVGVNLYALRGGTIDLMSTDIIYPRFDLLLLLWSFLFGVIVASVIAYVPARRAAKIEPVEALRSI
jgi:putative ABC transport system permease protein